MNSFVGKNKLAVFIEHNFHDTFFQPIRLPYIKKIPWDLSLICNSGWAGNKNFDKLLLQDFYSEVGFGLNKILKIVKLEFIWRIKKTPDSRYFVFNITSGNYDMF